MGREHDACDSAASKERSDPQKDTTRNSSRQLVAAQSPQYHPGATRRTSTAAPPSPTCRDKTRRRRRQDGRGSAQLDGPPRHRLRARGTRTQTRQRPAACPARAPSRAPGDLRPGLPLMRGLAGKTGPVPPPCNGRSGADPTRVNGIMNRLGS